VIPTSSAPSCDASARSAVSFPEKGRRSAAQASKRLNKTVSRGIFEIEATEGKVALNRATAENANAGIAPESNTVVALSRVYVNRPHPSSGVAQDVIEHFERCECRKHPLDKHQRAQRDCKNIRKSIIAAESLSFDSALSPQNRFATGQTQKPLMAVLYALPEQGRWHMYLRAEGPRYREIAEVLDTSLGSVCLSPERFPVHIPCGAEW
jgi:hypothetical protein